MRTLITLDYEVFFGRDTGSVRRSVLEPTEALLQLAARRSAQLVFFVDAGFILRLRADMARSAALRADHDDICRQLEAVARAGHEIQLHVHPHWETSRWTPAGWQIDLGHFALQSFSSVEISEIVARQCAVLRELAGPEAAYAYRAGGWVIQPFAPLRQALQGHGVWIDSTVFAGGYRQGAVQPYDFRAAPAKSRWRFSDDPLVEDPAGPFLEVPIASRRLSPDFFWRMALAKKLGGERHRAFGDGRAIAMDAGDLAQRLFRPSVSVVSIDGYKSTFLSIAAEEYRARGMEDFVVIGHPKALTPDSLRRLDDALARRGEGALNTTTFAAYRAACIAQPTERIAA
jgi:hypothetical protein